MNRFKYPKLKKKKKKENTYAHIYIYKEISRNKIFLCE